MLKRLCIIALTAATLGTTLSACVVAPPARTGGYDQDRDGVANRYDRDKDGDGTRNRNDDRPSNPYRR